MNRELRYRSHARTIQVWIEASSSELHGNALTLHFESAIKRLIAKARVSVNDLTLSAILDRIIYNTSRKHPILSHIKLESAQLIFNEFMRIASHEADESIREAFHSFFSEFFYIIGNLTAEQLTPILYLELKSVDTHSMRAIDKKES